MSFDECAYGIIYSDGEVKVTYEKTSMVPRKMMAGGQSQQRFQRARQSAIDQWFSKINEFLSSQEGSFILGISDVYYNRFFEALSKQNQSKVLNHLSIEYSDASGVYQVANRLKKG